MLITITIISLLTSLATPPADLAAEILQLMNEGKYNEAFPLMTELYERMPHNEAIIYNYCALLMDAGEYALADSLLAVPDFTDIPSDYIASARTSVSLADGILSEDYNSVKAVSEELKVMIISGEYNTCDIHNLEAALNWLDNHEPPDDQSQNQEDESENDDKQDEEEQDESSAQTDEDENEEDAPPDEQENQQPDASEQERQPPPSMTEMTPEQAQAILDMLSEPVEEDDETSNPGVMGVGDI